MLRARAFPLCCGLSMTLGLLTAGGPAAGQTSIDMATTEKTAFGVPMGLVTATLRAFESQEKTDAGARAFGAMPAEFVGRAGDCGMGYPAGANIVQAQWLRGIGLPDNGGRNSNPDAPTDNPNKRNPRFGLLLSKNGPTPDCSSAGARITGTGRPFTIRRLGFDYRNGSHCGAGAPRFNVITTDELLYFVGCSHGVHTPAPQDPTEWTRVRFRAEDFFPASPLSPPFELGVTEVRRLEIVNDEGTDTPIMEAPSGVGLIVLDNIVLNGRRITDPSRRPRD